MWNRKEIKRNAKRDIKKHLLRAVAVCFIAALVSGSYGNTLDIVFQYDETKEMEGVTDISGLPDHKKNSEIVNEMLNGGKQRDISKQEHKYSRGVFAGLFNSASRSGSFLFGFLNSFNEGVFHGRIGYAFILMGGALLMFLWWLLIGNMMEVNQCRFFMEASVYEDTPTGRILFAAKIRRMWRVAKVMFFRELFLVLWSLTIVGVFIKKYSYQMVPYIVAENPNVTKKEAFALSRKMMKGNKWKAFVLDLSFLGWDILGLLTVSILTIFYVNPYKSAARAELYMKLRKRAMEEKTEGYELLNDRYLTAPPLRADGSPAAERYPKELFIIPEHEHRNWITVEFRRNYTLRSLILLFFTFSMVGWVWEVCLNLLSTGVFVNRGVLHGPWLPIYGFGGVFVLVLLKKVRDRPWLTFILTMVICGTLEYFTSLFLEITKGAKWWDYSGYLLNLNGRICAEGLLVFGLGGCAFIYFFAPLLDERYKKMPKRIQVLLCVVLLTFFAADQVYSHFCPNTGEGITDYMVKTEIVNNA